LTPVNEFFTTSRGGWSVNFGSSCSGSCAEVSTANIETGLTENSGVSAGVVIFIILGSSIVISLGLAFVYFTFFRRSSWTLGRKSRYEKGADWKFAESSPNVLEASKDRADPELGGVRNGLERTQHLRQTGDCGKISASPRPPLPPHASALESPTGQAEIYEGVVNPWWSSDGQSQSMTRPSAGRDGSWRLRAHDTLETDNRHWNHSSRPGPQVPSVVNRTTPSMMSDFPEPPLPPPAVEPSDNQRVPSKGSVWDKFGVGVQPSRWKSGNTIRGPLKDAVPPAAKSMALAPTNALSGSLKRAFSKPVGGTKQKKQVRVSASVPHEMLNDLALAQKRNEAKLKALKAQLGER